MQLVDAFAFLERVQEGRERTNVDGGRAEPEQMPEDPVHLHENHTDHLAAFGDLDTHELLDRHHIGAVVDERRQIIHAVGERNDLIPRAVLAELLEGRVQVPDVRDDALHRLAIEFADQAQHSMRGRMLRPDVDEHVLGIHVRLGDVERGDRAERRISVHAHFTSARDFELYRLLRHQLLPSRSP